jgi:hypothetical protein
MKKILFLFVASIVLVACTSKAELDDAVVVEQINILEGQPHKYEVKLNTKTEDGQAYLYTNFRHQVGDTLISYYEFFESKNSEIKKVTKERDSLKKELEVANYYLQILKERVIIDSIKRK